MQYDEDLLLLYLTTDAKYTKRIDDIVQSLPEIVLQPNQYWINPDTFDIHIVKKHKKFVIEDIVLHETEVSNARVSTGPLGIVLMTFPALKETKYKDTADGRAVISFINRHYIITRKQEGDPNWRSKFDRNQYKGRETKPKAVYQSITRIPDDIKQ